MVFLLSLFIMNGRLVAFFTKPKVFLWLSPDPGSCSKEKTFCLVLNSNQLSGRPAPSTLIELVGFKRMIAPHSYTNRILGVRMGNSV